MTTTIPSGPDQPSHQLLQGAAADHSRKRHLGAMAVLVVLAGGLAACSATSAASTSQPDCGSGAPKLTVDGSGQASATPDILTIDIGVNVSDATASAALSDANGQATTLTNALKSSGVASSDIQSTGFSIFPTMAPSGAITGYQVSNTLLVTLHDLANAGQVVDTAAASVGNAIRINGLTFSVGNTQNVDGRARAQAVATAAAHARSMAVAAGESLGGICSISDSTTGPSPVVQNRSAFGASPSDAAGLPVPLEPGTQQATAQVTVVYGIVPK